MFSNWKKLFLWSSLGGLALGATVTLTRRSRKASTPLEFYRIPAESPRIRLWTERLSQVSNGQGFTLHMEYLLQPTSFRLWNLLDPPESSQESLADAARGIPIYHVSMAPHVEDTTPRIDFALKEEKFYGTVAVLDDSGRPFRSNHVARGGYLQIRKCLVGGAKNGVETGEIHVSSSPILNYRFA